MQMRRRTSGQAGANAPRFGARPGGPAAIQAILRSTLCSCCPAGSLFRKSHATQRVEIFGSADEMRKTTQLVLETGQHFVTLQILRSPHYRPATLPPIAPLPTTPFQTPEPQLSLT